MTEFPLRRVAIFGAGTVGGALAAHLTNLGFSVSLVDQTLAQAVSGVERLRPSLYLPERAGEIRTMGVQEGLASLVEVDWIVEALPEVLEAKRALFQSLAPVVRPDAYVSTCSPSLPISEIVEGLPDALSSRLFGASFALPLSQHRLVEVRAGLDVPLAREFGRFLAQDVARRVVEVPDGPGGILARYGYWCLFFALHVAEKLRLEIEDVEAITGGVLGGSGGGVFEAIDRVGLDEMRNVGNSLQQRLPNDRGVRFFAPPNSMVALIARGWTGDKTGRGYYRREGRERLALNPTTMAYRQSRDSALPGLLERSGASLRDRLRTSLGGRDEVGEFLREYLVPSLRYAEALRESLGVSVLDFDRTMEWGFGWERGPFALLDDLGIGAATYYHAESYRTAGGGYAPLPHDEVCPTLAECPVIDGGEGYTLHDLDDGVEALALHDGLLSPARVQALLSLLARGRLDRFVLTSEGRDFPALDLPFVLECLREGDKTALDAHLAALQTLGEALQERACVAAVAGRCLGPSLGLALSCAAVVTVADVDLGFPEARWGLLPTARGVAILRALHGGSIRRMGEVAVAMAEGIVASNAESARSHGFLRPHDVIEHLPERLLTTAKGLAQNVQAAPLPDFVPVEPTLVGLIDRGLAERKTRGGLTDYDVTVGQRIRQVVARTATYDECLDRERSDTIDLGGKALTQARLRHMIETGRPLRN